MKFTELPLIEYIDIDEQQIDLYIHTKDKRLIVVSDIQTDPYVDSQVVCVDHIWIGQRMSFMMLREDFSHLEYSIKDRNIQKDSRKYFDEVCDYLEDDEDVDYFLDYQNLEVLKEP
jgi:hypothetical protein